MRFELSTGGEIRLPAELLDQVDHLLHQEDGFLTAMCHLYDQMGLDLGECHHVTRCRQEWLITHSPCFVPRVRSRCDAL